MSSEPEPETVDVGDPLIVEGRDGRRVEARVAGPDDGDLVLLLDGTPTGGLLYRPLVDSGVARGVRHATYCRPGYAGSERWPGRSVADCAAEVEAVADRLGAERFYALGWSGGGPHALAVAALLPDRAVGAATIGGVAPFEAEGLDWLAGMGEENIEEFGAATAGGEALAPHLEKWAAALGQITGEAVAEALGDLVSDVDRQALTGEYADHVAATFRRSVSAGIWGWFDDDLAFVRHWGFELDEIAVPVAIWHGAQDRFVPFAHGEWLAERVPTALPHLLPDHGHLSLSVTGYGAVLDDLVRQRGAY